jgi:hypothetical protein
MMVPPAPEVSIQRDVHALHMRIGKRSVDRLAQAVPSGHGAPQNFVAKTPIADEGTVQLSAISGRGQMHKVRYRRLELTESPRWRVLAVQAG